MDAIIIATVQTLLFGIILAILGYFLNRRLESYKHDLEGKSEEAKTLLSSLQPHIQQRREAYLDFRQAAWKTKYILEVFYYRAIGPPNPNFRQNQLKALEKELGLGFQGGGASGSWATKDDALSVVQNMIVLREKYEDVSSAMVNSAVDEFLDTIMQDLSEATKDSNDTETFHNFARSRLREAFIKLKDKIEEALGIDRIPLK